MTSTVLQSPSDVREERRGEVRRGEERRGEEKMKERRGERGGETEEREEGYQWD